MPLQTLAEVEALVQSRQQEGINLDYKGDFTNNLEGAKKELAKDLSAFANSQGGAIILGVDEDRQTRDPVWPLTGVPTMLNARQKTVEWIEQTLNQNVAQRVALTLRQFELPDKPDRCVIVVDIPVSPRAPHMVTYQQDNRYYRRYFKRQQYESLPAEEYEVREMFQRSLRFTDETNAFLDKRGYLDPTAPDFARNAYTNMLNFCNDRTAMASTLVSLVAVPNILVPDSIDFSSDLLMQWLNSASRHPHPVLGYLGNWLVIPESRYTLDGRLLIRRYTSSDTGASRWGEFIFLARNGYVEYATTHFSRSDKEGRTWFALTPIVGHCWAFISFVCHLYHIASVTGSFRLLCNLVNAGGSYLHSFGKGWPDLGHPLDIYVPGHQLYGPQPSLDQHIQVVQELPNPDLSAEELEAVIRSIDLRIENAYDYNGAPRSFNDPRSGEPDAGRFAIEQHHKWS